MHLTTLRRELEGLEFKQAPERERDIQEGSSKGSFTKAIAL
ncbi:hypothetical protein [Leptolyngbya sp. PCC 6406]|nr:hypothetical protein [Leptolyngbya sp. PCC 6406]